MPKIVEFLGPSGVGKSALYHAVRKKWRPECPWVTFHDLHYRKKRFPADYYKLFDKVLKKLLLNPKGEHTRTRVDEAWGFLNGDVSAFLGDKNPEFTSVIMDLIHEHCAKGFDGSDRRFVTAYMMMWSIAHVHAVKAAEGDDRACLLFEGEGFLSRIMHLTTPSFDEEALAAYIRTAPLPDILFLLESPVDEIVKRIKSRNRFSSLHRGMDEEMIFNYTVKTRKLMKRASNMAEESGVGVYRLDTTKDPDRNVDDIVSVLTQAGSPLAELK